MAQGNANDTSRHVIAATTAAVTAGDLLADGDVVGVAAANAAAGAGVVLQIEGKVYTESVITAEVWKAGQRLYYLEPANVITGQVSDWPVGVAAEAKSGTDIGGNVRFNNPVRGFDLDVAIDYAVHTSLGVDGDVELRDFAGMGDGSRFVTYFAIHHDDTFTPGTATIAIGDGTGSNDQILAATALSALEADGMHEVTLTAPVALGKIVVRIASGPITVGKLRFIANITD